MSLIICHQPTFASPIMLSVSFIGLSHYEYFINVYEIKRGMERE